MAAAKKTAANKEQTPTPFYIVEDKPLELNETYASQKGAEQGALDSLYDDDVGYIYKVTLIRTVTVQSTLVDA